MKRWYTMNTVCYLCTSNAELEIFGSSVTFRSTIYYPMCQVPGNILLIVVIFESTLPSVVPGGHACGVHSVALHRKLRLLESRDTGGGSDLGTHRQGSLWCPEGSCRDHRGSWGLNLVVQGFYHGSKMVWPVSEVWGRGLVCSRRPDTVCTQDIMDSLGAWTQRIQVLQSRERQLWVLSCGMEEEVQRLESCCRKKMINLRWAWASKQVCWLCCRPCSQYSTSVRKSGWRLPVWENQEWASLDSCHSTQAHAITFLSLILYLMVGHHHALLFHLKPEFFLFLHRIGMPGPTSAPLMVLCICGMMTAIWWGFCGTKKAV